MKQQPGFVGLIRGRRVDRYAGTFFICWGDETLNMIVRNDEPLSPQFQIYHFAFTFSPPPASRRLDHQHIPRLHRHFLRARQFLTPAIRSFHPIPPNLARLSAGHAEGRDLAMIGEYPRR